MQEDKTTTKTFSIPAGLLKAAVSQAHKEEVSFSAWLCNLVSAALAKGKRKFK